MKVCPKCGITHDKLGTFCSRSCSNSRVFSLETNLKRSISNREYMLSRGYNRYRTCKKCSEKFSPVNKEKICPSCKKIKIKSVCTKSLVIKPSPISRTIMLVESGAVRSHSEASIRRHMKKYLLHKIGNVCSICGTVDWFGVPVPLVCDHIDGDSTNSDPSNFRLVCCNCDALLATYKSKNRGKGRKYDREYHRRKVDQSSAEL